MDRVLRNRYFILRHGESDANVAGIISSTYKISVANHGLTVKGKQQAEDAASSFYDVAGELNSTTDKAGVEYIPSPAVKFSELADLIVYASDFKRAYETGKHFIIGLSSKLGVSGSDVPLFTSASLRERSFGDFEGLSNEKYQTIWDSDAIEAKTSNHYNCESVSEVIDRTLALIEEIEEIWSGKVIVLVSHGDVCQIVQTAFLKMDPTEHRSLQHMNNCDFRELRTVLKRSNS